MNLLFNQVQMGVFKLPLYYMYIGLFFNKLIFDKIIYGNNRENSPTKLWR